MAAQKKGSCKVESRQVSFQDTDGVAEHLATALRQVSLSTWSDDGEHRAVNQGRAMTLPTFPVAKKPSGIPDRVSRFQFAATAHGGAGKARFAPPARISEAEVEEKLAATKTETKDAVAAPRGGGNLAHFDDTWHIMKDDMAESMPKDAVISDCRIDASRSEYAEKEEDLVCAPVNDEDAPKAWRSKSLISFDYRVVEVPRGKLLDTSCDALLFGHLDFGSGEREEAIKWPQRRLVVIDETVNGLYGEKVRAYFEAWDCKYKLLVLPLTEENKSVENTLRVCEEMKKFNIDRRLEPVIAIGGGVCLDVVGLAASLFRRRTPYIRVPTTSLSYVDASVGAKNGCNFCGSKNRLGTYVPPVAALLDSSFFGTQRRRDISNSLGEMAKMAIMKSRELFELLEKNGPRLIEGRFSGESPDDHVPARVLRLSIETMLEELAPNLWEHCLDRLVDFGHAVGQELEMKALGTKFELMHGEAVATDMAYMTVLAAVLGELSLEDRDRILQMLRVCQVPTYSPLFTREFFKEAMKARVANSMGQRLPLPVGIGKARMFNDIPDEVFEEALLQWEALCAKAPQPPCGPPDMSVAEDAPEKIMKEKTVETTGDEFDRLRKKSLGLMESMPDTLVGA